MPFDKKKPKTKSELKEERIKQVEFYKTEIKKQIPDILKDLKYTINNANHISDTKKYYQSLQNIVYNIKNETFEENGNVLKKNYTILQKMITNSVDLRSEILDDIMMNFNDHIFDYVRDLNDDYMELYYIIKYQKYIYDYYCNYC